MVLDEPTSSDNVYESEGIRIIFDRETSQYTRGFIIDYRKSLFGNRFVVEQIYSMGGSCS